MKLVTRISILFVILLALSLIASMLAMMSFGTAAHHIRQVSLAYQVHGHILSIQSRTYQLFKQFGDAMVIGDLDNGRGEAALVDAIRRDIREARHTIGLELEVQGEEELDELEELSALELKIERLIEDLSRIVKKDQGNAADTNWSELWRVLDSDIDRAFYAQVEEMLNEEKREIEEALAAADTAAAIYRRTAIGFALLALLLTVANILLLTRTVGRPLRLLLAGIREINTGNLAHRTEEVGSGDVLDIIKTINQMTERISAQAARLAAENQRLEDTVGKRTHQLEELVDELKASENNRRRMLTDVSHELRTPLTIIQGEADIALRGGEQSPDTYREALTRARDAARHTARIVDDLLFIARNEAGDVRLRIEQMDLGKVAMETISAFGYNVSFVTDLEGAPMRGDAGRIRQALLVLLENARHHGGDDVTLRLNRTPDGYCAAIEDNGPGMTDDEKRNAFERFFRGSNAANTYREGLGLGLPLADSVARAHGGSIELADRPAGGLIAALLLPKQPLLKAVA